MDKNHATEVFKKSAIRSASRLEITLAKLLGEQSFHIDESEGVWVKTAQYKRKVYILDIGTL